MESVQRNGPFSPVGGVGLGVDHGPRVLVGTATTGSTCIDCTEQRLGRGGTVELETDRRGESICVTIPVAYGSACGSGDGGDHDRAPRTITTGWDCFRYR